MKKIIIAVLAAALVIVVVCVFMTRGTNTPAVSRPPSQPASPNQESSVPRPSEAVPIPSGRESSAQRSSHDPEPSHSVESIQVPVSAPSTTGTAEPDTTLPKDHIAWSQERQMRQLLEMNPEQVTKFLRDYESWIAGKLARGAKIELTSDESQQLSELFLDATMDFCKEWHPTYQEALQQPGKARDLVDLNNAIDPDMMLMLYAIPAKQEAITGLVGAERYEKMKGTVDGAFQEWYQDLTSGVEYEKWMRSLNAETQQKVWTEHGRWVDSQNGRPRFTKWIESDDFRKLKEDIQK